MIKLRDKLPEKSYQYQAARMNGNRTAHQGDMPQRLEEILQPAYKTQ